ncbi:MAG TPA: sialate O-acetylesterase [Anaerohalosphaeraceae bacterium]|nr:sialate O-acetylesterase [Anaerohalosphaeraceae bacterium]
MKTAALFCRTAHRTAVLLWILFVLSAPALALEVCGIFGDSMVLQQGRPIPVWGKAASGEEITVRLAGQDKSVLADASGRWRIVLEPMLAGGPYEMTVSGKHETRTFVDVWLGEVWLCSGQSNMDMTVAREDRYWCGVLNEEAEVAAANWPGIRVFDVPFGTRDEPLDNVEGRWEVCSPVTVGHFSAAAYFFAREIHKKLNVPVGLITTAYGGSTAEAWISRKALEAETDLHFLLEEYARKCQEYDSGAAQKKYEADLAAWKEASAKAESAGQKPPRKPAAVKNPHLDQHSPCVLFNAMVSPLIPYAIRGTLWYQGESNIPTAAVYDRIMETLIRDWRSRWGQGDFPFVYVQLAGYGKPPAEPCRGGGTTRVREAQAKNRNLPNVAMVTAVDIGESDNIHPKNKQEVGRRLALAARSLAYGETIEYSGPVFESMVVEDNCIRLSFTHIGGGLVLKEGSPSGFAIAGPDRTFFWADVRIDGDTIVVCSPQVREPLAVRYAWDDFPVVSLYNAEGLPAVPFRTDSFE